MDLLRVLAILTLIASILQVMGEAAMDSSPCYFPAIYNFGDSNSDTGGIAAAFYPMATPCGETFFGHPAGRGCDGRLIIDFIAEHLGTPYLSPYLDSIGTNFQHGANFATGGATIRRHNESWFQSGVSPFPLDIQVEQYTQFKERSTFLYNQGKESSDKSRLPNPVDFSKALYTIDIGQNDLAAAFGNMRYEQPQAAISDMINKFVTAVRGLYQEGARMFWIHYTGPIGCLPVSTANTQNAAPGHLDEQGCVRYQNEMAMEFNKQLKDNVNQLRAELSEAAITYVDMYTAKYQLISNANKEGFEGPFKICCGLYENGVRIWCGQKKTINGKELFAGSCANPQAVISWDGVHYSEAANHWIAKRIINGSFSDPPIPIIAACHK